MLIKTLKKTFCCWENDTMHASKCFYLHCDPSTKVNLFLKLKSADEDKDILLKLKIKRGNLEVEL